jgi:hypothetical protein
MTAAYLWLASKPAGLKRLATISVPVLRAG